MCPAFPSARDVQESDLKAQASAVLDHLNLRPECLEDLVRALGWELLGL